MRNLLAALADGGTPGTKVTIAAFFASGTVNDNGFQVTYGGAPLSQTDLQTITVAPGERDIRHIELSLEGSGLIIPERVEAGLIAAGAHGVAESQHVEKAFHQLEILHILARDEMEDQVAIRPAVPP